MLLIGRLTNPIARPTGSRIARLINRRDGQPSQQPATVLVPTRTAAATHGENTTGGHDRFNRPSIRLTIGLTTQLTIQPPNRPPYQLTVQ